MSDQHNLKLWFTNVTCDGKISSQSLQIKVTNWNQMPCDTKLFQLQLKINTCGHLTSLTKCCSHSTHEPNGAIHVSGQKMFIHTVNDF